MSWFSDLFNIAKKKAEARARAIKVAADKAAANAKKVADDKAAADKVAAAAAIVNQAIADKAAADNATADTFGELFGKINNYLNLTYNYFNQLIGNLKKLESDVIMPNVSPINIIQSLTNQQYTDFKRQYDTLKSNLSNNSRISALSNDTNNIIQTDNITYNKVHNKLVKFVENDEYKNNPLFSVVIEQANTGLKKIQDIENLKLDGSAIILKISNNISKLETDKHTIDEHIQTKINSNKYNIDAYINDIGNNSQQWNTTQTQDTFKTMAGKQPYEFRHNASSNAFSQQGSTSHSSDLKSIVTNYKPNASTHLNYSTYI